MTPSSIIHHILPTLSPQEPQTHPFLCPPRGIDIHRIPFLLPHTQATELSPHPHSPSAVWGFLDSCRTESGGSSEGRARDLPLCRSSSTAVSSGLETTEGLG